jgi:protein-disulfide isomerase
LKGNKMKFGISKRKIVTMAGFGFGILALGGIVSCGPKSSSGAGQSKFEIASDISEGSKDAKVVMVEYASVMCPHCSDFQKDIIPSVMENYVKTGKIRYVFREFPTSPVALATAGHLLTRCVPQEKREGMISAIMSNQREIIVQAQAGAGVDALKTIAASAGMGDGEFTKCMEDKEKLKTLDTIAKHGSEVDKITGTPTILINGETYTPPVGKAYEYPEVAKAIDAALAKAK